MVVIAQDIKEVSDLIRVAFDGRQAGQNLLANLDAGAMKSKLKLPNGRVDHGLEICLGELWLGCRGAELEQALYRDSRVFALSRDNAGQFLRCAGGVSSSERRLAAL